MLLKVKVISNSKEKRIENKKDYLEVRVNSPPIEGKANKEVIELISQYFKVPKSKIKIKKGLKSKIKLVEIKE